MYKKKKFDPVKAQEAKEERARKVADMFIKAIKENKAPWQRPWNPLTDKPDYNMFTMKNDDTYKGYNSVLTTLTRFFEYDSADPRWMTMNNLMEYNRSKFKYKFEDYFGIKEGSHAIFIKFFRIQHYDKDNKWLDPSKYTNEEIKEKSVKTKAVLVEHPVFNVSQTCIYVRENGKVKTDENGKMVFKDIQIPFEEITKEEIERAKKEFNNTEKIEEFIKNTDITIKNDSPSKAYYSPQTDSIHTPPKETFKSVEDYYDTLFHEMIHATGHKERLNRTEAAKYSKDEQMRAREELIAEIGGYLLCQNMKLTYNPTDNNVAYVKSWCKDIENDPDLIFNVCREAEKAVNFLSEGKKRTQTNENTNVQQKEQLNTEDKSKGRSH